MPEQSKPKKPKVAVDRVFLRRLWKIFKIIFPSWRSVEALHLLTLTVLLFGRTLLSIQIADVTGKNAQVLSISHLHPQYTKHRFICAK
jgi:ATP-binding cassette subfamily D (ALD) protein 3